MLPELGIRKLLLGSKSCLEFSLVSPFVAKALTAGSSLREIVLSLIISHFLGVFAIGISIYLVCPSSLRVEPMELVCPCYFFDLQKLQPTKTGLHCKNVEGRLAGISRVSLLRFEAHQQKRIARFLLGIAGGIIEEEKDALT